MRFILKLLVFTLAIVVEAQEISLDGYQYFKNEGLWYVNDGKRIWEVNPEVITVKYKKSAMPEEIEALLQKLRFQVLHSDKRGYVDLRVPEGSDPIELALELQESNLTAMVIPCTFGKMCGEDPNFSSQWFHQRIDSPETWEIETGDPSAVVAVLDQDIDTDHPDLNGVIISSTAFAGPGGPKVHATEVIGIIAANTNNDTGVAGVAGGWHPSDGAGILHYQITNPLGLPVSAIVAEAIDQAVADGADIINMSFGCLQRQDIIDAIADAYNAGVFLVAATGNDDEDTILFPASSSYVFAVGGSDQDDHRAQWTYVIWYMGHPTYFYEGSNYGEGLDVVAPGITILSTRYDDEYAPPDTGTSFASPQVAGIAALLKSYNASLTNADIEEILASTAEKVGGYNYSQTKEYGSWNNEMGYGRVNAYAALASIPPENLTLENMSIGYDTVFTATNSITAGPSFTVENTGDVTFRTGNVITLKPGFTATAGSEFRAYIDPGLAASKASAPPVVAADIIVPATEEGLIPTVYSLSHGYPNPFNPNITIPFGLPEPARTRLVVYDLLGREVIRLVDERREPGYYQVVWQGRDAAGRNVPSGIYIARIVTPKYVKSIKMLLLK